MNDPRIQRLQAALEGRPPRVLEEDTAIARAAVSLLLRPADDDLEILLIQRPTSEHDPWSGHMALPGGRRQGDEDSLATAVRETREEVGLDLDDGGFLLGRLDDVHPSRGGPQIAVSPFVFSVPPDATVRPDPREVAAVVWIPLRHLTDPVSAAEHLHVLPAGGRLRFPAFNYHGHIIWGLTHRMLLQFLGVMRSVQQGEVS